MDETVVSLTGITKEILEKGKSEKDALNELIAFIKKYPILAHNVKFDLEFLNNALLRNDMKMITNCTFDTLQLARQSINDVENYKLDTLIGYYGLEKRKRHRALNDCKTTNNLFVKLKELKE